MSSLPWMKFFVADWRQEPSLRMCGRAARSLWLDLLGLMHEAEPYGHLLLAGQPPSAKQIAAVLGDRPSDVKRWLDELERNGVFSRDDGDTAVAGGGTIVSRRMLRDGQKIARNRDNGRLGGNPQLQRSVNPTDKPEVKAQKPEAIIQTPESETDSDSEWAWGEEGGLLPEAAKVNATLVRTRIVRGGAKRFAGLGEAQRPNKAPDKADQDLARHLVDQAGMPRDAAWLLIGAARDPASPEHAAAAKRCNDYSRRHKLGWFADRSNALPNPPPPNAPPNASPSQRPPSPAAQVAAGAA